MSGQRSHYEDPRLAEWARQQLRMAQQVISCDDVPWQLDSFEPGTRLERVGGLDISFLEAPPDPACGTGGGPPPGCSSTDSGPQPSDGASARAGADAAAGEAGCDEAAAAAGAGCPGIAALVVLSFPDLDLLYEDYEPVDLTIPYLPGFLGFREADAYAKLLRRAKDSPHRPQVGLPAP
ncbi:hypothetical protein GPECTOR_6g521 [Gonium pectorale]|uniref:Uncharacterized protein n=1 Tax=Gonium pectorale TaxID=33097 RepID=A0A150GUY0_GONPE|nr:hypothetical protein GPECTOR_6g521 [Gonium pectorale]|eukprot:KXZ53604.1 hypothetical protein GPECTOR_6g521 [Gonium pectorale]